MSAGSTILLIAGIAATIAAFIYKCKVDFLKPLCDLFPEGGKAASKPAVSTGANIVAKKVTGGFQPKPPVGSAVVGGALRSRYATLTNTGRIAI